MIIAVTCWRGLGATTAALALAAVAAESADTRDARDSGAWLIEADPAGGVLSGRVSLSRSTIGGLERVAFPSERCSMVEAFHDVAHDHGRLRIVTSPADPFRAAACHRPRSAWRDAPP